MTTNNEQNIEIAEMKKDIEHLKEASKDNRLQHNNDFYPALRKMYWIVGIGTGLMVAMTIFNFIKGIK